MNDNSTRNPTIIFYRTSNNAQESLAYLQPFLEKFKSQPNITVIDYPSDDNFKTFDLFPVIRKHKEQIHCNHSEPTHEKRF